MRKRTFNILCMCLVFMIGCVIPAFGAEANSSASGNETVTVTISGQHTVKNKESLKTGRHTFVLDAEKNAPMPEGSSNGEKKVTISSNEEFSFGQITYDKPGTYDYQVSREITQSENLQEDDSVYQCSVFVYNDGTNVMVLKKKGMDGKPDQIQYVDTFIEQEPTTTEPTTAPTATKATKSTKKSSGDKNGTGKKTGDAVRLGLCLALIAAAAAALIAALVVSRRKRNQNRN